MLDLGSNRLLGPLPAAWGAGLRRVLRRELDGNLFRCRDNPSCRLLLGAACTPGGLLPASASCSEPSTKGPAKPPRLPKALTRAIEAPRSAVGCVSWCSAQNGPAAAATRLGSATRLFY